MTCNITKMRKLSILLLSALLTGSAEYSMAQNWPEARPEAKAGARWWWLGSAVDAENLKWNIAEYASHGIGSLEITPIYGVQGNDKNNISYLSPEWMRMLGVTERVGHDNGVQIDMNTGTGWPFGGPETPLSEAACKAVWVDTTLVGRKFKNIDLSAPVKERPYSTLCKVMAYSGDDCRDVTPYIYNNVLSWQAPYRGEWRIIALYVGRTRQMVKRAAPGGEGYVIDHFDSTAVAHYLQKFDKAFAASGTPWPHTFFNDSYEVYHADWTPSLLNEFYKHRGYRLEEHFPELLRREDGVVADYRETLSEMLLHNFTEQWTRWANSHGSLTRNQAHGSPGNLIDLYAAVDIPEIEGFGLTDFHIQGLRTDAGFTRKNFSDLSMLKYAPSAAHITGKRLVSSETFTWLTEHFRTSLSQLKPDLDLMFTAGVNHVFYHGTCYSPKDDVWPGWKFYASIDMSPTNSIWRDASYLNKYIECCQSFLQWGEPDNDFLLYLPIRNIWSKADKTMLMQFDIHSMGQKAPEFISFVLRLDSMGYTSDYISDKYLLTTTVQNGMIKTVGGTKYKALVIPADAMLSAELKAHIKSLQAKGAHVFYGLNDGELSSVARPEEIKMAGMSFVRRHNAKGYHYFISNLQGKDVNSFYKLAVPFSEAMLFDPLTGNRYAAKVRDGMLQLALRSGESVIVETFNKPTLTDQLPTLAHSVDTQSTIALTNPWLLSFVDEQPKVNRTFTLSRLQTWETLADENAKITMGTGVYETSFRVNRKQLKSSALWRINLGDVRESARVYVNDSLVGCAWAAPFALDFTSNLLHKGMNKLRIEVTNLPANRIAYLDRRGYKWRKFNEINVVDLNYKRTTYENWQPMPSGLNSDVTINALR